MHQRHLPDKSGVPAHPRTMDPSLVDRDAIRPYPWPRAKYNEYLNNIKYVFGLNKNYVEGNENAALHPGIDHYDPRPQLTIQNLIIGAKQNAKPQ